ncbi:MAG: hypothetical protein DI527_23430 [Chelatococcus sp.]|nr:MAG: hypothetical protein DI527_23430 [Chelatococcus sp.]
MTWLQTCSNGPQDRAFDLLAPGWRDVDFEVGMPEALARITRYTGHVRAGVYSVAQHSVLGADALWHDTRDRRAAACFLLHDGHEYVLGDKATPIAEAEIATAEQIQPGAGAIMREVQRLMKARADLAIYSAAGLGADGCPLEYRRLVKLYDLRMLAAETRQLLGPKPRPWPILDGVEPARMIGRITVWPWHRAADEFRDRLRRYLPERFGAPRPAPKSGPASRGARLTRQPVEA